MSKKDSAALAEAWINFQRNWWAWDKLDELCRKDADGAWAVLQELTELADTDELLEDIGVGPLEDFFNYYADSHIIELEQGAVKPGMGKALAHASVRDNENPMAERLAALGCQIAGKVADGAD